MLINMIHDNHGELPFKTRFRDPAVLGGMGYEAIVIPDALSAIPAAYSEAPTAGAEVAPGVMNLLTPADVEKEIDGQVKAAVAAGMKVFFYADALLLPAHVVKKHPEQFLCDDLSGRLCPAKPAVLAALQDQVQELFDRWPLAAGLVMRTGEVYPEATPHMIGSPLHAGMCAVCKSMSLQDRLVGFIGAMYDVVVGELGKQYVHRAWMPAIAGLPNMHDDPAVYREIVGRLPESAKLAFSFKFTRGDFVQGYAAAPFNPCLLADERPKWIEFQCEREYEGKGAFPNYQAALWQKLLGTLAAEGNLSNRELHERFSVWGWSRGGGWGGPYVQREEWIDANVHALAGLFRHPSTPAMELASAWTSATFGVAESAEQTPAIVELLLTSAPTIRKLLYCSGETGTGDSPWVKDDLLDVEAIWASAQRILDAGRMEEAYREKREAMQGVNRIRQLFDLASPELPNRSQVRGLTNSLAYFSSFAATVVNLFVGFVQFGEWVRAGRGDTLIGAMAVESLERAQAHWQDHTQRHTLLPGAPSVFQENTLWDRTNSCLEQLRVVQ
jgi:hypothetical protein